MRNILFVFFILLSNFLFGQFSNDLTQADKIFGLSKFWQEVNYNFVYLDKVDKQAWESEYIKLINEVQTTENDYEYYRLLQKFCRFLKDGHTNIYFPESIQSMLNRSDFGDYKFYISNIEGKAIITRINFSKKDELPVGTEIIKVNGLNTDDFINIHVRPYVATLPVYIENNNAIRNLLYSPMGTHYSLELKLPNGKITFLDITHKNCVENEFYPKREKQSLLDFKWVKKDLAYVALNSFSDSKIYDLFKEKVPELYKAKALIIDLRNNTGGSSVNAKNILSYLTNDKMLFGAKSSTRQHIPTYKAWGAYIKPSDTINGKKEWGMDKNESKKYYNYGNDQGWYNFEYLGDSIKLKAKRIVIPTVVLIGNRTASAAEDFLIYSMNQSHMTTIGEPSYGSTGQPILGDLPGGGRYRICTKKDTYPNGKEFVGYGIQPQIKITKTLNDFLDNKDAALNAAIEYLTKK